MRAEESRARAKKPVIERHRMSGAGTLRVVTTWLPVHKLTTDDVWKTRQDNGIAHHEAYDQGMRRLSCRACPLAHTDDLVRSAQLNPELFAEYAEAEAKMGHPSRSRSRCGRSSSGPGADRSGSGHRAARQGAKAWESRRAVRSGHRSPQRAHHRTGIIVARTEITRSTPL